MATRIPAWCIGAGALAFALTGCGDDDGPAGDASGAADSSTAIDAAPAADVDPSCVAWRLESVGIASASLMETVPVHPDRSARILVAAQQCPGDLTARTTYAPTLENEFLAIDMRVWRSGPDCATPEIVNRPVTVRFLYPGSWTILTAGTPLVVDVVDAPDIACGASVGNCVLDCDCTTGEVCLSGTGLGGPFAACARPCEVDRDCLGTGVCTSVDDGLSDVCIDGIDECAPERPCPDGFTCAAGACDPTFELNGTTRHPCTCDSQCDPGLRCAWAFGADQGRCDALCLTNSDGWCQGPHSCEVTVETGSEAVCGWVGD